MENKQIAREVRDFFHYMDSCDDFFEICGNKRTNTRDTFALLLRDIRNNHFNWKLSLMKFYCDEYFLPRSHPSHYNKEFLFLLRTII